jgi:translation initiation factor 1
MFSISYRSTEKNIPQIKMLGSVKCDEAFDEVEDYAIAIVDIWVIQRNGRKCYTDVKGLAEDLDLKKLIKYWGHEFHCSVAQMKEKTDGDKVIKFIRLQGDQRELVQAFLIAENIISKEFIKVHGF